MVLNAALYDALTRVFGYRPRITNAGEPFSYDPIRTPRGYKMKAYGEQYSVCCPDCGDRKFRLYFHHRFGTRVVDERFPGALVDLCFCQHEQKKKPKWFSILGDAITNPLVCLEVGEMSRYAPPVGAPDSEVPTMGDVTPLRELPRDHQAVQYLIRRGYEPTYLSDIYGACLMNSHPDEKIDRMVKGRIGFPFLVDGKLKCWQARLAYDLAKGEKYPPKWYFPPKTKKVAWGYDVAKQYKGVIVCEGILSAVNFGPAAIAIGGKTLVYAVKKMIVETWDNVFVALDPDAGLNRKGDEKDFQKRLVEELKQEGKMVAGAVWTPGDMRDPGDIGPHGCVDLLRSSAPWFVQLLDYVSDGSVSS